MNANGHELPDEKLCCLAQHTAHGRVGRRVATESAAQRLLIATTAGKVFPQPANIRAIRGKLLVPISAH
jgi:hypothetical protein